MEFIKIGKFYINLSQITFISTSEYNFTQKSGQIVVRFAGESQNHVVVKDREATQLLKVISEYAITPSEPEPPAKSDLFDSLGTFRDRKPPRRY